MFSQLASRVPTGGQWLYEPKFDGFRGLLRQAGDGLVRLTSCQGKDLTGWFPDLYGISIGSVTLLDESRPWWVGVGGITKRFGVELDSKAIAAVPVLLVVGELDAELADVPIDRDESVWTEGINDSGRTRRERITSLQRNLEAIGASTRLVAVPNVAHAGLKVFAPVIEFFSRQIRG